MIPPLSLEPLTFSWEIAHRLVEAKRRMHNMQQKGVCFKMTEIFLIPFKIIYDALLLHINNHHQLVM